MVENSYDMGIPDHLTCLLRNLYAGQEATVRTGHGTTDCVFRDLVRCTVCGWRKCRVKWEYYGQGYYVVSMGLLCRTKTTNI